MDHLQTRLAALEQRTQSVERQLRWWRGLAGGLLVLAVMTWALPIGMAKEDPDRDQEGLEQRVSTLESLLKHFSRKGNDVTIEGANLHLVNGLGQTDCGTEEEPIPDCPNELGNLIVGYNESRVEFGEEDIRTGSHNIVVGQQHNFSRFGGLAVGHFHTISGDFAVVSGGEFNIASGRGATVSGGTGNMASTFGDTVSGGAGNTASGSQATVSGGNGNFATGANSSVSGGLFNVASEFVASVSGGTNNIASGPSATVSGGVGSMASGFRATVSGGRNRTAEEENDWVAGDLFQDE